MPTANAHRLAPSPMFSLQRATASQATSGDPGCAASWFGFERMRDETRGPRVDRTAGPMWLYTVASAWTTVVYHRCATE